MQAENSSVAGTDSEDDFDWEEVVVPQADAQLGAAASNDVQEGPSEPRNIEITIQTRRKQGSPKKSSKGEQRYAERLVRLDCHKVHTVCLLANARVRNRWINDPLLHARLMSLTPLALQNAFATINKARVPEAAQRGRMFEAAVANLAKWWSTVFEVDDSGHIRNRTFDEVQKMLSDEPEGEGEGKGKGNGRAKSRGDDDSTDGEVIKSAKSLMKHALMLRGSRDTSAQLFTALCRALGIPARLVVSLQSVPWQAGVGKPKPPAKKKNGETSMDKDKGKGKAAANMDEEQDDEDEDVDMEEVDIPNSSPAPVNGKGKGRAKANGVSPEGGQRLDGGEPSAANGISKGKQKAPPVIRLRKSTGRKLGGATRAMPPQRAQTPNPTVTPPVFWTEVFSRADARWLPIDPIRCIVNKRKAFDPTPSLNATTKPDRNRPVKVENRMVYVVAFEEDGYARDVTPRYAREYGARVAKVQQGGKGRREWWERILGLVARPYKLHRDDLEDEELETNQLMEAMPTSMAGFKDHPLYALERHLKRDEVLHPLVELGKFRGEPVYPRSSVVQLKTAENWTRQGRKVREGCQPMKWVKQRAVTVNKKRAIETALAEQKEKTLAAGDNEGDGFASEGGVLQGLYAENQTEVYRPRPVVDGKVPKNDFGNIDLYVPSMLPEGAAHLPFKGTAKIARQLGFDYAEAVTGFEFKKRRAFPVISGIVVAAENATAVLEAHWAAEQDAEEKRRAKRQEQVIKRWIKLVHGLRIRQRLQEQYADRGHQESSIADEPGEDAQPQGGFLTGADDVVQPYTLPRNFHEVLPQTSTTISLAPRIAEEDDSSEVDMVEVAVRSRPADVAEETAVSQDDDDDADMADVFPVALEPPRSTVPRTLRELAEAQEAARQTADAQVATAAPSGTGSDARGKTTGANTRSTRPGAPSKKATPKSDARRTRKRARQGDAGGASGGEDTTAVRAPPAKRARAGPAHVPAPTRVLRARTAKSAAQIQEEKEMEAAYRRAVAG
ncbi:Rad4-domain-containing protein [Amylocystis lapponica]|nr:Rad4-domain-containing protein [Amylocystis lapponica]